MARFNKFVSTAIVLVWCSNLWAACPLDHFMIGCNRDGIFGTQDDNDLFVDCTQKYRHSDPDNTGEPTWLNWYYPLYYNERYDRYQIGEPGFDLVGTDDPNRQLAGTADEDYRIIIECTSITPGFSARNTSLGIILDESNDWFNHSALADPHIHLEYRAPAPGGASELQWISFRLYDAIEDSSQYRPSNEFTVVFVTQPQAGDLAVDGKVDVLDLGWFTEYWLCAVDANDPDALGLARAVDYFERADINKDYRVDWADFAFLAENWQMTTE
jgi:hypothetical protein